MKRFLVRLTRDERGATAIEYGLIAALVFLVILGAVTLFSENATNVLIGAANAISGAASGEG
ncbi:MAG: pilus assembly protein Flp/PilA [Brevundimonas sp.]|jgi:pilus assembly protein Flp/PilA|uniref:Flp family type IVb pilin n=1 Tax=Brevundimonas sp. TaxID=1871086 RepID=UPI0039E2D792